MDNTELDKHMNKVHDETQYLKFERKQNITMQSQLKNNKKEVLNKTTGKNEETEDTRENTEKEDGEVIAYDDKSIKKENEDYETKHWKGAEGEKVGFIFDGGKDKAFAQASQEIKKLFNSNKEHEIGDLKFSLTEDKRKQVTGGMEYLIKVNNGDTEEGAAVLSVWGPNSKKECKIGIKKSKNSDAKFVEIMAVDIIKKLLDKHLSGRGWKSLKSYNVIKCTKCEKTFCAERYLSTHIKKYHVDNINIKDDNLDQTDIKVDICLSMESKSYQKEILCLKCKTTFKTKVEVIRHNLAMHPTQVIPCQECDKKFKTEIDIRKHKLAMHQTHKIPCQNCDKKFKTEVDCQKHVLAMHPTQEVTCQKCDKKFSREVDVTKHLLTMHKEQEKHCRECDKKCKTEVEYRKHVLAMHPIQNRYCDECDLVFKDISLKDFLISLNIHKTNICPFSTERRRELDLTKSSCKQCCFKSNSRIELMKHMRDVHSEQNEELSPVPKKIKFYNENEEEKSVETEKSMIEDILDNILQLNLGEKMEVDVEKDNKVIEKRKREDEEGKQFEEKKRIKEDQLKSGKVNIGKEKKDVIQQEKKKKEIEKTEIQQEKVKLPNGVEEIDLKFHHMVGNHKIKYPSKSDGTCQNTAKAAILYSDPRKGTDVANEENKYLVAHFEHFVQSYEWPHIIKIGGGKTKIFKEPDEFKVFLEANQEACYMWGEHQQLQITSNRYQVPVNVLTIDSTGNGTVLKEPFTPNPALKEFALVPEGAKVKEVWLLYTNGNHYDALITADDTLVNVGTIEDTEKAAMIEAEMIVDENEEREKAVDQMYTKKNVENTTVTVEPKEIETDEPIESDEKDKMIKELKKELKTSQTDKQKLEVLYRGAEEVVKKLQEEKDRLLIQVKDFKEFTKTSEEVEDKDKNKKETKKVCNFKWKGAMTEILANKCKLCDFKSTDEANMANHIKWKHSHKKRVDLSKETVIKTEKCTVYNCNQRFETKSELNKHIKSEHLMQFNCELCDFQASNILILNKHINIKHRDEIGVNRKVFHCEDCDNQYSDYWNIMKHRKESHEIKESCRHFMRGRCKFSDEECWLSHGKKQAPKVQRQETKEDIKCYVCEQTFNTRNGLMRHRKQYHPEGLRKCKDDEQGKCEFGPKRCWYMHFNDVEGQVFQSAPVNLEPPELH